MEEFLNEKVFYCKNESEVESLLTELNIKELKFKHLMKDVDDLKDYIENIAFRVRQYKTRNVIIDVYVSMKDKDDRYYL